MRKAKVTDLAEIAKLKESLRLSACKCNVEGCENIGAWSTANGYCFYTLKKGMCEIHYRRFKRHGNPLSTIRDGRANISTYMCYWHMIDRCYNPKNKHYADYGGRGITVCPEWLDEMTGVWQHYKDMGEKPINMTVNRKDNNGNYNKNNCEWADAHTQAGNLRSNNEIVGVSFNKQANLWHSYLTISGKRIQKHFKTKLEAVAQRKAWEIEYKIYE